MTSYQIHGKGIGLIFELDKHGSADYLTKASDFSSTVGKIYLSPLFFESDYPPTNILVPLGTALKVNTDELLGLKPVKKSKQPDNRLLRRMQQIDNLDAVIKRQVMQVIDTFIENAQLKKHA